MFADLLRAPLVSLIALGVVLAGCSSADEGSDTDAASSPDPSPASSASAPTEPAATPQADAVPSPRPAPERGEPVEPAINVWALELPPGGAERPVAETLVRYLDLRLAAYHHREVPRGALSAVAAGAPLTDVEAQVADLRETAHRTVGDAWLSIDAADVTVRGRRARLEAVCMHNATVNVDAAGVAQESPPDAYRVRATATRRGAGNWRIDSIAFEGAESC